jgi:energy-coupling factor transporter ATP-binding protein EcfA2
MAAPATRSTATAGTPDFSVRHLWKVFGPRARAIAADESLRGLSSAEIMGRTGCVTAVRDVSFDVAHGEVFVVMGLSGSGKSTLVRCLTRLIEPTAGEVRLEGEDILGASEAALRELRRRRVLPRAAGLAPHLQALLDPCVGEGAGTTLDRLIARLPHEQLVEVAAALEKRLGMAEEDLPEGTRIMTWDELRALAAAGLEIGGHTGNHAVLSNVPLARARAEICGCRDHIEAHIGQAPRHFAYPNGFYTAAVRAAVAEAGFASAVTTEDVENRRGGDAFTLKRKTMWENSTLGAVRYSPALAACNLDGVFGALGWQRPTPGERPDVAEREAEERTRAAG